MLLCVHLRVADFAFPLLCAEQVVYRCVLWVHQSFSAENKKLLLLYNHLYNIYQLIQCQLWFDLDT